jgi:hypothetical protein
MPKSTKTDDATPDTVLGYRNRAGGVCETRHFDEDPGEPWEAVTPASFFKEPIEVEPEQVDDSPPSDPPVDSTTPGVPATNDADAVADKAEADKKEVA